ncbi:MULTISPECIES: TrkA family potassium uptake protein [Planococcus]|uniref:Potassium transporter Trk n=1 Tax=Planococcus faecalis TaxID=1598147 RepID=A0ABM6IVV1_9BACL|nr:MULTISPECIES: TrkA family potassium uptake protein [Planococcus]AQU80686.1 potassium transporter Trk [Planococcus faecalis]MDJ0333139.1 TrkA family potassium uptake protein [Planococcus sp. S3-L1]OHX55682.1 potassium transporter Trk [Planococcus faecalis]
MKKEVVIIGLGRFGTSMCRELNRLGHDILAIDTDEEKVNEVSDCTTQAVIANATDENVLTSLGVRNFEHAVVAIGDNLQSSVLCTLILKEMGISTIWVKARDLQHQKILEKVGADRVIQPEYEMGVRMAHHLNSEKIIDYINLSEEYSIIELVAPPSISGKTLFQLDIRAKFNCTVLAIKRFEDVNIAPSPEDEIVKGNILVLMGHKDDLKQFEEKGLS